MSKPLISGTNAAQAPTQSFGAPPLLNVLLNDQRQRWRRGERVLVESYLTSMTSLQSDREGILDLICNEVVLRSEKGDVPQLAEYLQRFASLQEKFPDLPAQLRFLFEVEGAIQADSASTVTSPPNREA